MVIEPDTRELDEETVPDEDIVISVCAGLVTIDQETDDIRLVHYITQEYLERLRGEYFPTAQVDVSRTCLTYVSLKDFAVDCFPGYNEQQEFLEANVFLDYAAHNWSIHAVGEPETNSTLQHLIVGLLEHPSFALGTTPSMVQVVRFQT